MSIVLNDNIRVNAGKPSEPKYLNTSNVGYANTAEVLSQIPIAQRHEGLIVKVGSSLYWFRDGVSDIDLIPFEVGSSYSFSNGIIDDSIGNIKLGGDLIEPTTIGLNGNYLHLLDSSTLAGYLFTPSAFQLAINSGLDGLLCVEDYVLIKNGFSQINVNNTLNNIRFQTVDKFYYTTNGFELGIDVSLLTAPRTQQYKDADGVIQLQDYLGTKQLTTSALSPTLTENGKLLSWDNTAGKYDLKSFSSFFTGTSSQFVKGDGSLDSNTYALISDLSGYAKLDGTNMPFTGAITIKDNAANEMNSNGGYWRFSDFRGIGSRVVGEQLVIGVDSGRVDISSTTRTRLGSGAEVEFGGTSYRFCRGAASNGDYRAIFYPENSATGGGYYEFRHTDGAAKWMVLTNRDSDPYNAYFKKAIIVGDSSPTVAGALRYNSNSHQTYNGSAWQFSGGIGQKELDTTAANPSGVNDGQVYYYDYVSGKVSMRSLSDPYNPTIVNTSGSVTITTSDKAKMFLPTSTTTYTLPLFSSVTAPFIIDFVFDNQVVVINPHASDLGGVYIDDETNFNWSGGYGSIRLAKLTGSTRWRII